MRFRNFLFEDLDTEDRKVLEAGASLSRVLSKLKDESVEFGIITAFRKYDGERKVSLKENQRNNNDLLRFVRSQLGQSGYGAYRLVGHWKECSAELPSGANISQCGKYGGTIEDSLEESWLIINEPRSDKFFDVLQMTAKKFRQDAFISRVEGNFGLFGKDGSQWERFGKLTNDSISSSFKKIVSLQGYSELKKKTGKENYNIVFDTIKENIDFLGISVPNDTNASSMLYSSMNLLWK